MPSTLGTYDSDASAVGMNAAAAAWNDFEVSEWTEAPENATTQRRR